jgi:hypothetical protein
MLELFFGIFGVLGLLCAIACLCIVVASFILNAKEKKALAEFETDNVKMGIDYNKLSDSDYEKAKKKLIEAGWKEEGRGIFTASKEDL